MKNQTVSFATLKENGVVTKVGKSIIKHPKPNYRGGSIKWFDDNKLLKTNKA